MARMKQFLCRCVQVKPFTVFPRLERVLDKIPDALYSSVDAARFRSRVDWFLCAVFPAFKKPCFRFYAGKGKAFEDTTTPEERAQLEQLLLGLVVLSVGGEKTQ